MDNSPAWDEPMAAVPLDGLVAYRRTDTDHVQGDQRPTTKDYDRYAAIIGELRKAGYDPEKLWQQCSFRVADAATNAILVRADADLVRLGRLLGEATAGAEARAQRSAAGLQKLWSPEHGHFLSIDLRTGRHLLPATSASFLGYWAGTMTQDQAAVLGAHLDRWESAAGSLVPSTDPEAAKYEPGRYWRGPVWVNLNWMIAEGLRTAGDAERADRIDRHTRRLISRAGMWEYFQPATGEGLGAADFGWTAALARYWLAID
jgi:glycogen debranching enzyme